MVCAFFRSRFKYQLVAGQLNADFGYEIKPFVIFDGMLATADPIRWRSSRTAFTAR